MSVPEQPGGRPSTHGNQYQHIEVREGATAQLGNTYYISRADPLFLLPVATRAHFNSYDRQHEPTCLPDTRVDLLQGIYDWADGKDEQDERCIFWLNGPVISPLITSLVLPLPHSLTTHYNRTACLSVFFQNVSTAPAPWR
ncbi:hypothetical protein DL95DRAFT_472229 [Leptodontidium sp. 2 PMI_412]|nr:hypothetical protein DL95DRAFT_472229 [Leptodontidium sp. 2 PMI_412]